MAYEKLGFVDNETPLDAAHFNHMEEGIARANSVIETSGGDTLTWDGDITKLEYIEFVQGYKISDAIVTAEDVANGATMVVAVGDTVYTLECAFEIDEGSVLIATDACGIVCVSVENPNIATGMYIMEQNGYYPFKLIIPGYTGFGKEIIKQDALPEALRFGNKNYVNPVEILPLSDIANVGSGGYALDVSLFNAYPAGNGVRVSFDGVVYEGELTEYIPNSATYFYGNKGLVGMENTGEPFILAVSTMQKQAMIMMADGNTHAVSITVYDVVYETINENCLPNAVLYVDAFALGSDDATPYLYKRNGEKATCEEVENAVLNPWLYIGACLINSGIYQGIAKGRFFPLYFGSTTANIGDELRTYAHISAYYSGEIKTFYSAEYEPST